MLKKSLMALICLCVLTATAAETKIKGGTMIGVKLMQNLTSKFSKVGDPVLFEVIEDVIVDGNVVVKAGAPGVGKVTEIGQRGNVGKGGELGYTVTQVEAVDGQKLSLVRDNLGAEGRERTGTTVAQIILWGPFGLLTKGRHAVAIRGTEFDVEIRNEESVDTSKSQSEAAKLPEADGAFAGRPDKDPVKINFLKGKKVRPFKLELDLPSGASGVRIVKVNDMLLKRAVSGVSGGTRRNPAYEFDEWAITRFFSPGMNTVVVHADQGDEVLESKITFQTKWREK